MHRGDKLFKKNENRSLAGNKYNDNFLKSSMVGRVSIWKKGIELFI